MVRFSGVDHFAMATGDMDRTIRFWRDLLGMRLVAGLGRPGYRHYFFQLSDTGLVAFFEWPGVEPMPKKDPGRPVKGPFIFDHVSLGVEKEEDLWELIDRLEVAGLHVSDVIDHGFFRSIYSFDPNGIPIEFSTRVPGIDVTENPTLLDTAPSQVRLEGPEPQPDKWPAVERPTPKSLRFVLPGAGSGLFRTRKR